jgi:hypothetical protein
VVLSSQAQAKPKIREPPLPAALVRRGDQRACFIVRDANGQALAYAKFRADELGARLRHYLQSSRYLRQLPIPCSPSSSLWRQACRNSLHPAPP